jgi:hypothetical protein
VDDFNFDRTSDILFRNDSSGDTWVEVMSNGAFANWSQIGGSNTSYAAVGVGDFYGTGTAARQHDRGHLDRDDQQRRLRQLASDRRLRHALFRGRRGRFLR